MLKALAVPVFYLVYKKLYGGITDLDAGKFFHDVEVIHSASTKDFGFYIRLMFGLQNEQPGSYDFVYYLKDTVNWDNGTAKDYLYNDNRVLIRLHTLVAFIAFHSYFVHALFSCLLSFIGLQLIYRSLKSFFAQKEPALFLILCFVPALWFYTGALLKEGPAVFILGHLIYLSKKTIEQKSWNSFFKLLPFLFLALLLKPYLLLFSFFGFFVFFMIEYRSGFVHKSSFYFIIVCLTFLAINFLSLQFKQRSLLDAALKHRRTFAGVAKGGIFLAKGDTFVRLVNNSNQIIVLSQKKNLCTIKKNVSYMYWEHNQDSDTLFCAANKDTSTVYEIKYKINESHSNINVGGYEGGVINMLSHAIYYSLFYPMFIQAKGMMQLLASFENFAVLLALIAILYFFVRDTKSRFVPLVLLFICISICLLVGIATPNSGAIFRYRSPLLGFIFIALLYYLPANKLKKAK